MASDLPPSYEIPYIYTGVKIPDEYRDNIVKIIGDPSLRKIDEGHFSECSNLKIVDLRNCDKMTEIDGTFSDCTSVTSIQLPDEVTKIGEHAFFGCTSLASIKLPDKVTEIGVAAFGGCIALTSIQLPDKVTKIGEGSFYGCTELTFIQLSDKVTEIGLGVFYNCTSLTSIQLPDKVNKIGDKAFNGCTSLTSIQLPDKVTEIGECVFHGCTELTFIQLPDKVTKIGEGAFCRCTSLTSIQLPDEVTEIGVLAFSSCTSLTSIKIPDKVTEIDEGVFQHCTSLTSIQLPDKVTVIGTSAFRGCTSLTSIQLSDNVTEIGQGAFYSCTSLTSIQLPDKVTKIVGGTFDRCTSLISIFLSDKVIYIGDFGFYGCCNLITIAIPSVITVGTMVFEGCDALRIKLKSGDAFDTNALTKRFSELPLHHACYWGKEDAIEECIKKDPACARMTDEYNLYPLHILASNPNATKSMIQNIVKAYPEATSNFENNLKMTPLHFAISNSGNKNVFDYLPILTNSMAPKQHVCSVQNRELKTPTVLSILYNPSEDVQLHLFQKTPCSKSNFDKQIHQKRLAKVEKKYVDCITKPDEGRYFYDLDEQEHCAWVQFVKIVVDEGSIETITNFIGDKMNCSDKLVKHLAFATDEENRRAIDVANQKIKNAFCQRLFYLGRYEFEENNVHCSDTCIVRYATDSRMEKQDPNRRVAVKTMFVKEQFHRELEQRLRKDIDEILAIGSGIDIKPYDDAFEERHVVRMLRYHNKKGEEYCIIMRKGDRTLKDIIQEERITSDINKIFLFAMESANALKHLHEKGMIHSDFKPRNIVRVGDEYKLIDFDASTKRGDQLTDKFSLSYMPPEVVERAKQNIGEKPKATEAIDAWSYGVVMYEVLTGKTLFSRDLVDDSLKNEEEEARLINWNGMDIHKPDRVLLKKCENGKKYAVSAMELLDWCLQPDPEDRPNFHQITQHSFLNRDHETSLGTKHLEAVIKRESENSRREFEKVMSKVEIIIPMLEEIQQNVRTQLKLTREILGDTAAPRYFCIIPDDLSLESFLEIRNFVVKSAKIYFICPVTLSVPRDENGDPFGYPISLERNWVKKYGPALCVGLKLLNMVYLVGEISGLPLSSKSDGASFFKTLTDNIFDYDNARKGPLEEIMDAIDDDSKMTQEKLGMIEKGYLEVQRIAQKLDDPKFLRSGLRKVICKKGKNNGDVEYVWKHPKIVKLFEEKGKECLGLRKEQILTIFSNDNIEIALVEGRLKKQIIPKHLKALKIHKWLKRYFVLCQSGRLVYYETEEARKQDEVLLMGKPMKKKVINIYDGDNDNRIQMEYADGSKRSFKVLGNGDEGEKNKISLQENKKKWLEACVESETKYFVPG